SGVVASEDVSAQLLEVVEDVVLTRATDTLHGDDEDSIKAFLTWLNGTFPIGVKREELPPEVTVDSVTDLVIERVKKAYELKARVEDANSLKAMERFIVLQAIDSHWQEYLRSMDTLRQGVGLRAYGQRDP